MGLKDKFKKNRNQEELKDQELKNQEEKKELEEEKPKKGRPVKKGRILHNKKFILSLTEQQKSTLDRLSEENDKGLAEIVREAIKKHYDLSDEEFKLINY